MATTVGLKLGDRVCNMSLTTMGNRIEARFGYNPAMIEEIKTCFEGKKWHPKPDLFWSFEDSQHNQFRLKYMMGMDPYARYDMPLPDISTSTDLGTTVGPRTIHSKRGLFKHQLELKAHGLTRRQCIWAADPGVGKSLAAIEVAEDSGYGDWWWIAPKAALFSVQLEAIKWGSTVKFRFMTYEKLVSTIASWKPGDPPPRGVIFDESSRLKNSATERSKAAKHLADNMRKKWGDECYVILMSGTPAPQSPMDWYSQTRIACPGYLKEGSMWAFRDRISLWKEEEAARGGTYPKLVTWFDDPAKCQRCGQGEKEIVHNYPEHPEHHAWTASRNEVSNLYNRMQGLVMVKRKADCLDLPEKIFRRIQAVVPADMMRLAKMVTKTVGTGSKALTLLREFSDGFQYEDFKVGEATCDLCDGAKAVNDMIYIGPDTTDEFLESLGLIPGVDIVDSVRYPEYWEIKAVKCNKCRGTGKQDRMSSQAVYVGSPKDDILEDIFDEFEDVGRLVIYGAFQASIDKLVQIAVKKKWDWIKADGRSWASSIPGSPMGWLAEFQNKKRATEKLVFIGQPEAAGMGLTLTEACAAVFYSNSFNAESRLQAIERIHRTGASKERGVTIIDITCLPTDAYVLERLEKKENLQSITLGSLEKCLEMPVDRVCQ